MKINSLIINKLSQHFCAGNDSQFARKLGISPQTLSNWKARNKIDHHLVYTKCVGINPDWLLTGKGEMLIKDVSERNLEVSEPRVEYVLWKDKCMDLQEEVMKLQKRIIKMQEDQNAIGSTLPGYESESGVELIQNKEQIEKYIKKRVASK